MNLLCDLGNKTEEQRREKKGCQRADGTGGLGEKREGIKYKLVITEQLWDVRYSSNVVIALYGCQADPGNSGNTL